VKYTARFTKLLEKNGLKPNPLPITSPNLNGRCEKFIGTIKAECLSRFIVFGKRHLDYLVSHFCEYYNKHRAHSGRNNLPPIREVPTEVASLSVDQVVVRSHVGGLIRSFDRQAA
jgi:putative transposase